LLVNAVRIGHHALVRFGSEPWPLAVGLGVVVVITAWFLWRMTKSLSGRSRLYFEMRSALLALVGIGLPLATGLLREAARSSGLQFSACCSPWFSGDGYCGAPETSRPATDLQSRACRATSRAPVMASALYLLAWQPR